MSNQGMRLGLVLFLLTACGCSPFSQRWEEAMSRPIPTDDIAGPWEGRWQSRKGHGGGHLRAVIERVEATAAEATPYIAHFRATWWGIFKSSYSIPLMRQSQEQHIFAGEKDLGWLMGGLYTYSARITPTTFDASYASQGGDSGIFQLARPGPDD